MLVSDGERMLLPLYHGTSTMFHSSIVDNGLGAVNPNDEVRSLELISELYSLEGWNWCDDPELIVHEPIVQSIIGQRVTSGRI